jgi:hypothetical protein
VVVVAAGTAKASAAPHSVRSIVSLVLFGIAFGYVEASVVIYLRTIGGSIRAAAGLPAQDLFPLLRLDQLPPALLTLLRIELGREAATLIMLAGLAVAVARGVRASLGAFLLAFGVWDLAFYLWLRVLIGWPPSLLTWDILFLLPVPWAAPVLAPAIVAATMSVFGARLLTHQSNRASQLGNLALALGAAVVLASFIWDWRRWMNGVTPEHFPWAIFALGELLIIAGFLSFFRAAIPSTSYSEAEVSKLR